MTTIQYKRAAGLYYSSDEAEAADTADELNKRPEGRSRIITILENLVPLNDLN